MQWLAVPTEAPCIPSLSGLVWDASRTRILGFSDDDASLSVVKREYERDIKKKLEEVSGEPASSSHAYNASSDMATEYFVFTATSAGSRKFAFPCARYSAWDCHRLSMRKQSSAQAQCTCLFCGAFCFAASDH